MTLDPQALTGAVAGVGAVGWIIFKAIMDKRKAKEHGLSDNPSRCAEHAVRITALEKKTDQMCEENREDHGKIFAKLEELAIKVARLNGK